MILLIMFHEVYINLQYLMNIVLMIIMLSLKAKLKKILKFLKINKNCKHHNLKIMQKIKKNYRLHQH